MKKAGRIILTVFAVLLALIVIIGIITAAANAIVFSKKRSFISTVEAVTYDEQLQPRLDDNGFYYFKTDREFRVMQLTDVHFGGGYLSSKKDDMAINAVSAMITAEKPDLVIVTGDLGFPVPFTAGTFNNKLPAIEFAELMERLGVYWCLTYGNHDTESYSYFGRKSISALYEDRERFPHCLFQSGDSDVDGYGNYVINIKNSLGEITQSLFMIDSHSYTDGDYLGIQWKYDCVHENQIEWYRQTINSITEQNQGIKPNSLAFMHIPVIEMRDAFNEYRDNGFKDTDRVKFLGGAIGERGSVVYSSNYNNGLFDAFKSEGSTKGIFFGHDHLNNFSLTYDGIRMTYGNSIDYLAYKDIDKYGSQRGCTMITLNEKGEFDVTHENYYQDKYVGILEKEDVTMEPYYSESEE